MDFTLFEADLSDDLYMSDDEYNNIIIEPQARNNANFCDLGLNHEIPTTIDNNIEHSNPAFDDNNNDGDLN